MTQQAAIDVHHGKAWPYILPFAVFMGFTFLGGQFKDFYPHSYVAKTFVVAGLLWFCWKFYTRVRWTHLGLGVLVGVVGVVQWIGMEKLFMSHDFFFWTRMSFAGAEQVRADAFKPHEVFASAATMWAFIAIRLLGASLVVPVMEELFWRDYLWRTLASPNDYTLHEVGEYDRTAFWLVPVFFATVHPQWVTSIVWALLIAWLLWHTRSLGACIVAHGVTNLLLGAYVLVSHYALGRDEWYFW
jgi:uncharacterized protein